MGKNCFLSFKTQGQPLILLSLFTEQWVYYSLQGGYVTMYTGAARMFAILMYLRVQARCLV